MSGGLGTSRIGRWYEAVAGPGLECSDDNGEHWWLAGYVTGVGGHFEIAPNRQEDTRSTGYYRTVEEAKSALVLAAGVTQIVEDAA